MSIEKIIIYLIVFIGGIISFILFIGVTNSIEDKRCNGTFIMNHQGGICIDLNLNK